MPFPSLFQTWSSCTAVPLPSSYYQLILAAIFLALSVCVWLVNCPFAVSIYFAIAVTTAVNVWFLATISYTDTTLPGNPSTTASIGNSSWLVDCRQQSLAKLWDDWKSVQSIGRVFEEFGERPQRERANCAFYLCQVILNVASAVLSP